MEPSRCLLPFWLRLERRGVKKEAAFIRTGLDSHRKYQKESEKTKGVAGKRRRGDWGSDTQETEWKGEAEIAKMDLEGSRQQ